MITIDHERYGERTEFESIDEAQEIVRAIGDGFESTEFHVRGDEVIDERGDVVGSVTN